jgi:protein-L-isoaspartate(D-aspartate) O-methyltransferase
MVEVMAEEQEIESARERMVEQQLVKRGIRDPRVLEAMRRVPRHRFIPPQDQQLAYADGPLPIGYRQTISQPFIVALMTQLLELEGEEKVLEVGAGSGYQAAVLAHLAKQVYSVERIPELATKAEAILHELGYANVQIEVGDGTQGLPAYAPYDGIIVTAAAPRVPRPLKDQLAEGGRLVLPVGSQMGQMLERWRREGAEYQRETLTPVAFVPLVGEEGWESDDRPTSRWF